MLNGGGDIHGGCSAFLVDVWVLIWSFLHNPSHIIHLQANLTLAKLFSVGTHRFQPGKFWEHHDCISVTKYRISLSSSVVSLNYRAHGMPNNSANSSLYLLECTYYRADKLRIVNTTLTIGARAHSARTEVNRRPVSYMSITNRWAAFVDLEYYPPPPRSIWYSH